jgi:hypothetical protein
MGLMEESSVGCTLLEQLMCPFKPFTHSFKQMADSLPSICCSGVENGLLDSI